MHYYQFNIGDYLKSTQHLSEIEDLAYRRLLDLAYDTEKPLVPDLDKIVRLIRMKDFKSETQQILEEFFSLTKKGYIQKRVQKELTKYSLKAQTARDNGKLGGRPVGTQRVNLANPVGTQSKAKQETRNKKQETLTNNTKGKGFIKPSLTELIDQFADRVTDPEPQANNFLNHYESNGWKVGKNPMKSWKHAVTNWITRGKQNGTQISNGHNQPKNIADEALFAKYPHLRPQ